MEPRPDDPDAAWRQWATDQTQAAQTAWDSGRTFYVATALLERADGGGADDAAGLLQAVESVGWALDHVGYAPLMRTEIPGGFASVGGFGVLGKNRYVSDLVAIYTFRRPQSNREPRRSAHYAS